MKKKLIVILHEFSKKRINSINFTIFFFFFWKYLLVYLLKTGAILYYITPNFMNVNEVHLY